MLLHFDISKKNEIGHRHETTGPRAVIFENYTQNEGFYKALYIFISPYIYIILIG